MLRKLVLIFVVAVCVAIVGCKDDVMPKPASHLRLEYPASQYVSFENQCPFAFSMNADAIIKGKDGCNFTITYPKMRANIYLSYKPVNGNIDVLLRDAQNLTYEHVIKADDIVEQPFINGDDKVYGMFYQVQGNAATNAQFYVTDSTKHFVVGSVYFYAKPNFDSVMPAANYIKNDMRAIMETLKWK